MMKHRSFYIHYTVIAKQKNIVNRFNFNQFRLTLSFFIDQNRYKLKRAKNIQLENKIKEMFVKL